MEQDDVDLRLIGKHPHWNSGGGTSTLINLCNGGLEEGTDKKRKHLRKSIKQRSNPINLVLGEEVKCRKWCSWKRWLLSKGS